MKQRLQRLVRPAGITLAVITVLAALGFVERSADRDPVRLLDVQVNGGEGVHFIDEATVRAEVLDLGSAVVGAPIGEVDLPAIEQRLRNIPCVAGAEVYHTMDGVLHVKVMQREPIVRIFNGDGTSFYIDRDGWSMPTSDRYTARVLVVTGALQEPGADGGVRNVYDNDSLQRKFLSDDVHRLALFIDHDPLWSALIDQVVVTPEGQFELLPRVGGQRICIGDGQELEQRFNKLKLFYEKGMPQADWRRYARIDLRFADQIVCTKRTTH